MKKYPTVRLTRSVRKHLREEKAAIRRANSDPKVRAQKIAELYGRFGVVLNK